MHIRPLSTQQPTAADLEARRQAAEAVSPPSPFLRGIDAKHFCACNSNYQNDLDRIRLSQLEWYAHLQAEARQAKFDTSAVGKAARKAVENVKKEREADAAAAQKDNSRDWLS